MPTISAPDKALIRSQDRVTLPLGKKRPQVKIRHAVLVASEALAHCLLDTCYKIRQLIPGTVITLLYASGLCALANFYAPGR
jgi:hypothetical protein